MLTVKGDELLRQLIDRGCSWWSSSRLQFSLMWSYYFKAIDLVIDDKIAVEVESDESHISSNIEKLKQKKYDKVLIVCIYRAVKRRVEEKVKSFAGMKKLLPLFIFLRKPKSLMVLLISLALLRLLSMNTLPVEGFQRTPLF